MYLIPNSKQNYSDLLSGVTLLRQTIQKHFGEKANG
jgi:hypothetical protein